MKCAREIQKRKWGEIQSEKCSIANGQTGGGRTDKLEAELNLLLLSTELTWRGFGNVKV